jgi:hypothetical protein
MRTLLCATSLLALLAAGAAAKAQPTSVGPTFRNQALLLMQESVRQELKLSDEQAKQADELSTSVRDKMEYIARNRDANERRTKIQELMNETDKSIATILKPDQTKRLKQVRYQLAGLQAFNFLEVAQELKITDEQKKDIQGINQETATAIRELNQGGGLADQETIKKFQEIRKGAVEKVVKLFNDEQKKTWKEMLGEPFKGKINLYQPR